MTVLFGLSDSALRILVEALLNNIWQGAVLAALIWLLLRLFRHSNAATRYSIWFATLLAIISLPFLNALTSPRITVRENSPASSPSGPLQFSTSTSLTPRETPALRSVISTDTKKHTSRLESSRTEAFTSLSEQGVSNGSSGLVMPAEAQPARESFSIRLRGERWPQLFLMLWMLGVVALILRIIRSYLSLQRLKRTSLPLSENYQQRLSHWLKICRIGRTLSLHYSTEVTVPLILGLRRAVIIFPERLAAALADEEFDQVLLHELAHARRRDDWTNLMQKLLEAFFFFHPVIWLIGRQLNAEREMACDQWVVSLTGAKRSYASCLAKLFELTRSPSSPLLAPGAMKIKSHLSRRIETILKNQRNTPPHLSLIRLIIPLCLLCGMLVQFGRVPPVIALSSGADDARQSAEQNLNASTTGLDQPQPVRDGLNQWPGNLARPTQETTPVPLLNDNGHQAMMQRPQESSASEAFRFSGTESGIQLYALPESALTTANLPQAITQTAAYTSLSSTRQPEILNFMTQPVAQNFQTPQGTSAASAASSAGVEIPADFFKTVAASDSSALQRELLSALLKRDGLKRDFLVQSLLVGKNISSDGEKAEFLVNAAAVCTGDDAVLNAFFNAVASIKSDGEQRRVLSALLKLKGHDKGILNRALKAVVGISSDGEKAELLLKAASLYAIDKAVLPNFLNAVASINSSAERRRALTAVLRQGRLSEDVIAQTVRFARSINSDGEKAEFLVRFAELCMNSDAALSAYMATASSIGSSEEQKRALLAVSKKKVVG
ncbi:MAG TPA: M56 family metallopeptidase [Pyrinomonadaceae bacterium]|jgi:beta-lactamase regulating signal transducer with metallopeptidase domain